MSQLPCLNPNCGSHGKPHPNCKCYLAHGGEVGHVCYAGRAHEPECEFYKDGGEVQSFDSMKDEGAPKNNGPASFDSMKDEGPPKAASPQSFDSMKDEGAPDPNAEPVTDPWAQAKAAAEGFASGYSLNTSKYIEDKTGVSTPELRKQREEQFPMTEMAGKVAGIGTSMVYGPLRLLGPAGAAIGLSGLGAQAVSGALQQVAQVTADDVDNYLIGKGPQNVGDAIAAWALHAAPAALMGAGMGAAAPAASTAAEKKLIENGEKLLMDLGKSPISVNGIASALGFGVGAHAGTGFAEDASNLWHGKETHFIEHGAEAIGAGLLNLVAKRVLNKPVNLINGSMARASAWALANNNAQAIPAATRFAGSVAGGIKVLAPILESLTKATSSQFVPYATEKQKEYFKKNIEDGGPFQGTGSENQPHMASGGEVAPQQNHFGSIYPEANMMMGMAKGRIYNYMNSIRPTNNPAALPFDSVPPNKAKQRSYDRAVELAVNPLSIMNGVNKGNLVPEDVNHLKAMWPEVHTFLSKKMTQKIVEAQTKGEKPPYHKRQAMSLFLGANLDSTFTPQAIQSIQMVYSNNKAQQMQQGGSPKRSTSQLSKIAPSSLTNEQARVQRQQNQKA